MNLSQFLFAQRNFQYDYIYFDAIFLIIWLCLLLRDKQYRPLLFGVVIAPIIYFIDAVLWWNHSAGSGFPVGTYIREYWIGGLQMPHPLGRYFWLKFGADFMMTVSYAFYTFPWLMIVFKDLRSKATLSKQAIKYTAVWFVFWLLVPLLSQLIHWNDTPVVAIRHMNSQFPYWIANLVVGYGLLAVIYRHNLKLVCRILGVGVLGALVMELPLWLFHIRPTGLAFVLFEGFFLLNQGVPYLFLIEDKVLVRKSAPQHSE